MLKTVALCESLQHNECAVFSPQMHATGPGTCIACGSSASRQEHCHRDTKCSCSHCTLSALQHRSACNIWAAAETGSYALLALPATLQTGKACHHAHSTPLHASNIQRSRLDYRFVQDLHGNSCIWKQASNSKCVHTIFYAKLMMRTTPVSGHAWRPCLDGS